MDYILQKEYDNLEKVLYQFNTLIDDVKALEREIQVLERQGAPAGYTARSVGLSMMCYRLGKEKRMSLGDRQLRGRMGKLLYCLCLTAS